MSLHVILSLDRQGYWNSQFGCCRDVDQADRFLGKPEQSLPAGVDDARFVTPEEAAFQGDFEED